MNDELLLKISELEKENSVHSYNKIIEIINKQLCEDITLEYKKILEYKRTLANINILTIKLANLDDKDYKEIINLRGKLIKLYKKAVVQAIGKEEKMAMKHNCLEELKKHKEIIKEYKTDDSIKISIPQKVGLNILEISKSIEIFMKEKDILTKFKNIGKDTILGTTNAALLIGGITLAIQLYTGVPLSLSSLVSSLPVLAYIGLSSIIKNLSTKTEFEQYEYYQSMEYKSLVEAFNKKNKKNIEELAALIKDKENLNNNEDKIILNEKIIKKIDTLADSTEIKGVKNTLLLQALSCFRENKEFCEEIKDAFLEEKNDNKEKYNLYKKKLLEINLEIFKRENSLEEAVKAFGKNVITSTEILLITKAILACSFPAIFPINGLNSILEPLAFALINGIIDIPTYRNKLKYKETEYEGKVKLKDKERIEQIIGQQKPSLMRA